MAPAPDRTLSIQITTSATNPALLTGLQALLRLELISDRQIKQIASQHLQCRLPDSVPELGPDFESDFGPELVQDPLASGSWTPSRRPITSPIPSPVPFPITSPLAQSASEPSSPQVTSVGPRWFQSFMDELSVLWLLFLGVFLVVVSSAVLAASQWQNFSAVGQYSILLVYTLAFWGTGLWASRQPNLHLTSRMVQRVTLMLVPINFWAMDGFALWRLPLGWGVGLVSAIALTLVLLNLLRPRLDRAAAPKQIAIATVALSWLHWGWAIAILPLLASYIGMIGAAIAILYGDEPVRSQPEAHSEVKAITIPPTTLICLFGALLLVGRAILVAQVPLAQFGLAFGLCGAVLVWRSRSASASGFWVGVGGGLVALGWLVALQLDPPWQSLTVSLLALGMLAARLQRSQRPADLAAIFLIGLQSLWLARRFVPLELRTALVDRVAAVAGSSGMPFAVVGITIFPYLLLFLVWSERFRRRNQPELSRQADFLCLALGAGLTVFSMGNPLMRSLNLTFSALTLGWVLGHRNLSAHRWPYLTQALFWGAIFSWVRVGQPHLRLQHWLTLTLVGMLVEWGLSLWGWGDPSELGKANRAISWRRSAWHTGLGLAVLSYGFCLIQATSAFFGFSLANWSIAGGLIPLALMALVQHPRCVDTGSVRWVGIASLFGVQLLMLPFPSYRIAGLGLATLLMGWHSRLGPTQLTAGFTVGFGVVFSAVLAFRGQPELGSLEQWVLVGAAIALLLWCIWGYLRRAALPFQSLYAQASNGWAIALFLPVLLMLSIDTLRFYWGAYSHLTLVTSLGSHAIAGDIAAPRSWTIATALLAMLSMGLCLGLSRNSAAALGLAIATELFLGLGLGRLGVDLSLSLAETIRGLAIANLGLALLIQQMGRWQPLTSGKAAINAGEQPVMAMGLAGISIAYASWAGCLGHWPFTAWTGVLTLAAAIVVLRVSRRQTSPQPVAYLALLGLSLGAYELLIYQLMQASGGNGSDGVVALALLGAVLAWGDRLLARWLVPNLRLNPQGFRQLTHVHWGLGSLLALIALLGGDLSRPGELLWMLTLALLGTYALSQDQDQAAGWADLGLVQGLAALGYGLHLVFPWPLLLGWSAAIACLLAALLQRFPWQSLGWSPRPGQRWATLLPVIMVVLTAWEITIQSLLIVAVFYAGLAAGLMGRRSIRLSYISLGLLDWVLLRLFEQYQLTDGLWYAGLLGATLLFVAQIDPELRARPRQESRHWLRCLGSGIVCFTALYQGQVGIGPWVGFGAGLVAIALSFGFILTGITLRVRAFLYVGTTAFVIQVLLQVWQFVQDEPLLLWAIGIVLGMVLIWIAATFEARRSQVIAAINHWVTSLESWQ